MAAGDTSLSICSDALILLGAAPISSFTEGSDAAQACDQTLSRSPRYTAYQTIYGAGALKRAARSAVYCSGMMNGSMLISFQGICSQASLRYFKALVLASSQSGTGGKIYGDQVYTQL